MHNNFGHKVILRMLLLTGVLVTVGLASPAKEAEEALRKSAAFFREAKAISLNFRVRIHYEVTGEQASHEGDLLVGQGDRFRLRIPGQQHFSDGVNLWQFNETQKQVLLKSLLDLEGAFHPSEILFKYLKCKPLALEREVVNGKNLLHLKLDPKGHITSLTQMSVWLDPANHSPVRMKTVDITGNQSFYEIFRLQRNPPVNENDFTFRIPPGVDELDMR